jgi:hypothetical protein
MNIKSIIELFSKDSPPKPKPKPKKVEEPKKRIKLNSGTMSKFNQDIQECGFTGIEEGAFIEQNIKVNLIVLAINHKEAAHEFTGILTRAYKLPRVSIEPYRAELRGGETCKSEFYEEESSLYCEIISMPKDTDCVKKEVGFYGKDDYRGPFLDNMRNKYLKHYDKIKKIKKIKLAISILLVDYEEINPYPIELKKGINIHWEKESLKETNEEYGNTRNKRLKTRVEYLRRILRIDHYGNQLGTDFVSNKETLTMQNTLMAFASLAVIFHQELGKVGVEKEDRLLFGAWFIYELSEDLRKEGRMASEIMNFDFYKPKESLRFARTI